MTSPERNTARRHHTVPQFYLRGFADNDQIATVRLPGDQRFVQSVKDASVTKNFYSVEGHLGGEDVIEKELSKIEGAVAAILKKIVAGSWPLDPDDRMSLGFFVALQATRVPVQRRSMEGMAAQIMRLQIGAGGKDSLRKRLEEQGGEVDDELVENVWDLATQPGGPRLQMSNEGHIKHMVELAESLVKYVVGRPWVLVQFDRRSIFTSDSPVGLIPHPKDEPWRGVGYMTAWGITFPLTRKLGLLMGNPEALIDGRIPVERVHQGDVDRTQFGSTALEKLFNGTTVMNASEWLFHHPDDEKFVPEELPMPDAVGMEMDGESMEFSGEPWFKPKEN
ncbi:MAG: DUF4238 domain-containing protein [Planctomycetaceae bacterium]|nr:DUF4238 domain-containing protein [Planctomycetaceae bacterium]